MLKSIVQIEVNRDAPVEKCLRFLLLLRYSLLCYLLTAFITKAPPFLSIVRICLRHFKKRNDEKLSVFCTSGFKPIRLSSAPLSLPKIIIYVSKLN